MTRLTVGQIWRYPVKSLHGEQLQQARVGRDGVEGDRTVHVRNARGVVTGRSAGALLPIRATTGTDGVPTVGGHRWTGAEAARLVRAAAGPDAELAAWEGPERFDILPLTVATDAEAARWGADRRRLRPNLVIEGAAPQEEQGWPGFALHLGGDLVVGVASRRPRCIVTTYDPDTGVRDGELLRRIHREFDGRLALDCWVVAPGTVSVGDPVHVRPLEEAERATHPGGGGWITGAPYEVPRELTSTE